MYNVSQAYKNQLKQPFAVRSLRGTIGSVDFTAADIVEGSLRISNQCSDSGEIKLGSVYTASMDCVFINGLVEREEWKGKVITLYEGLTLSNQTVEEVPIGVFVVDEATHTEDGIQITAYDNMLKFDKTFSTDTTYGKPYDLLNLACTQCGVTLGLTQVQVEALTNGTLTLYLSLDNDIETWRDFIFWVAQTLACFATITRDGKLTLRQFGADVIDVVSGALRFENSQFSDFVTEYTGIAYTDKASQAYIYYGAETDTKLTYNLGVNPFIQDGTEAFKEQICRAILTKLQEIEYVPFLVTMLGGPVYDLGDVFQFTGGRAEDNRKSCAMFYEYRYTDGYTIEGYGSDPATASARSNVDKQLTGIMRNTNSETMQYYTFTNAEEYIIGDSEEETIIDIRFASLKATTVIFQTEILLDADTAHSGISYTDIEGTVTYILNNSEWLEFHPKEIWVDGHHILNLFTYFEIQSAELNHLVVKLNISGGSVTIPVANIRCAVYGQGLAAVSGWDGLINFEDEQERLENAQIIGVLSYSEEFTAELLNNVAETITELQARVAANAEPGLTSITDSFSAYFTYSGKIDAVANLPTYDATAVEISNNAFVIKSGAQVPQALIKTVIDTQITIAAIQNVQMTLSNCTFRFSPDGTDWYVFSNGSWVTLTTGMSANDVANLTSAQWLALVVGGRLDVEIIMTDANSTVTEFSIDYLEDIA